MLSTAWQNQQKEFADLPAPILFTTNCLMPPKPSYAYGAIQVAAALANAFGCGVNDLVEQFGIAPITTPEADLKPLLN